MRPAGGFFPTEKMRVRRGGGASTTPLVSRSYPRRAGNPALVASILKAAENTEGAARRARNLAKQSTVRRAAYRAEGEARFRCAAPEYSAPITFPRQ